MFERVTKEASKFSNKCASTSATSDFLVDRLLSKLPGLKISNVVSTDDVSSKAFSIYVIKSSKNGFLTYEIK